MTENLSSILPLLRCPVSLSRLQIDGNSLVSESGIRWPLEFGRPCFIDKPLREFDPLALSHPIPPDAEKIISNPEGLYLNLSAGNSVKKFTNVIEIEVGAFTHTDVVADAHRIPFEDSTFDGVMCLNAFEHYHSPLTVISEIRRVAKKDASIYVETACIQPLHMEPFHFFNATYHGVLEWFKEFDIDDCLVPPNGNPVFALSWLACDILFHYGMIDSNGSAEFAQMTIGELREIWEKKKVWDSKHYKNIEIMPDEIKRRFPAVVALKARNKKQ